MIPEPPILGTTRPTAMTLMLGAASKIALPTSKRKIPPRYSNLTSILMYNEPNSEMVTTEPSINPVPIHNSRFRLPREASTRHCAAAEIVEFTPCKKAVEQSPTHTRNHRRLLICTSAAPAASCSGVAKQSY